MKKTLISEVVTCNYFNGISRGKEASYHKKSGSRKGQTSVAAWSANRTVRRSLHCLLCDYDFLEPLLIADTRQSLRQ